eukprot:TRINITY_DN15663_c0_g1_i1.p1 TRINITY_DN15663_c0_g1~~TRINITY_DN15663_c0_g1_i1.p1  ORF type:complete len:522 (+),score=73.73 TRINITY_DN15663_c0_g1_i1:41-1606(+)
MDDTRPTKRIGFFEYLRRSFSIWDLLRPSPTDDPDDIRNEYHKTDIFFRRLQLVIFVLINSYACHNPQPIPTGLAHFIDLSPICLPDSKRALDPWILFFGFLYSFDILTHLSSGFLLVWLVSANTVNNSSGAVYHGNQLAGLLFLTDFVGRTLFLIESYLLGDFRKKNRKESLIINWMTQVVAGAYVVCSLTKMIMSNGEWLSNSKFLPMGLLAINERATLTYGVESSPFTSVLARFLLQNPFMGQLFFAPGFLFEFFFPICLWNRFTRLIGGVMLYSMHVMITYFMRLEFGSFKMALLAFFVDVPFWIRFFLDLRKKSRRYSSEKNRKDEEKESEEDQKMEQERKSQADNIISSSAISRLYKLADRIPLKTMILIIVLCLLLKEAYPFTNYPMFGNPVSRSSYYKIVDRNEQPIAPVVDYFTWTLAKMGKFYQSFCKTKHQKKWFRERRRQIDCGNRTMTEMIELRFKPSFASKSKNLLPLKLIHVEYFYQTNSSLAKQETVVGYYPNSAYSRESIVNKL